MTRLRLAYLKRGDVLTDHNTAMSLNTVMSNVYNANWAVVAFDVVIRHCNDVALCALCVSLV